MYEVSKLTQVFYSAEKQTVIDFLTPEGVTCINGESLEKVRERYPDAVAMNFDDYQSMKEEQDKKRFDCFKEIDEERYWNMLECLPPMCWRHGSFESFQMMEYTTGDWTGTFVFYKGRYFETTMQARVPQAEIWEKLVKFFPELKETEDQAS